MRLDISDLLSRNPTKEYMANDLVSYLNDIKGFNTTTQEIAKLMQELHNANYVYRTQLMKGRTLYSYRFKVKFTSKLGSANRIPKVMKRRYVL